MNLAKLFLFSVWVTLIVWAVVEYNYAEQQYKTTAPTVIVTPQPGE